MEYDDFEPDDDERQAIDEWWAWHFAHEREPQPADEPRLRATVTVDPGDYL
jgi:hypothetical protein